MNELSLRPAGLQDARVLFEWTNDPDVRNNSINTALVGWDDHQVWLRRKLADRNCLLLVALLDEVPVATVRFDRKGTNAVISISVDRSHRGRGVGSGALALGIDEAAGRWPIQTFTAYVKPENAGSLAMFERLGFERKELVELSTCSAWQLERAVATGVQR